MAGIRIPMEDSLREALGINTHAGMCEFAERMAPENRLKFPTLHNAWKIAAKYLSKEDAAVSVALICIRACGELILAQFDRENCKILWKFCDL